MDMIMDKSFISCRKEIWTGSARREEMTECVVPDTYPDIGSIIDVCAQVLIRGKEAADGKVTIGCAALCTALYTADGEGEGVFRLETEIPFSITADVPEATEETDIIAGLELENVEVRLLNPRKILTKAEICASVSCYNAGNLIVSCTAQHENGLQLLEKTCAAAPVTDVREKTFVISDEITMPPVPEGYTRLLSQNAYLTVRDVKFVGSKLIFKGEAEMRILAEANGNMNPVFFSNTSSFSQIIELSGEAETAEVKLCLTGLYLNLDENDLGKPIINAELHMLAQAIARVEREISYIADAYSNSMDCELTCESMTIPQSCIQAQVRDTFRCTMETPFAVREVIYAGAHCSGPKITTEGVSAKVSVRCMYLDENGTLRSTVKNETMRIDAELPEDAGRIEIRSGEVYASPAAGGIDIRLPVEAIITVCPSYTADCVTNIALKERTQAAKRPSLYVIPTPENIDMWQLAKKYSSTTKLIEKNNPETGEIMIIPVQGV